MVIGRVFGVAASLALSACVQSLPVPDIQENPRPQEHYRMTLRIGEEAPGPFDQVVASANYQVSNDRCVPLTPGSGATLAPHKVVNVAVRQLDAHTYEAEFYRDRLLDADYYHQGVCHWMLTAVDFGPVLKGNAFNPFLSGDDLAAGRLETTQYFSSYWYFNPSPTPYAPSSQPTRSAFKEPDKTFSVSLRVERLP